MNSSSTGVVMNAHLSCGNSRVQGARVNGRLVRMLVACAAVLAGAALWSATSERAAAAPGDESAADVFSGRFVTCPVTTDLERRLLGNHGKPLADASLCVFVNGGAFAAEGAVGAKARPFLLLSAYLKRAAPQDDRLVVFHIVVALNAIPVDAIQKRAEAIGRICKDIGKEAGYKRVRISETFQPGDFDWKKYVADAEGRAGREPLKAPSSAGNGQVRVYAVHTLLERLLARVDCVVDILPMLRGTDGVRFPDDFLKEMKELIPKLEFDGRREMLVCVQYTPGAKGALEKWINDVEGRKAFAKEFGFEFCNLRQSMADNDVAAAAPAAVD